MYIYMCAYNISIHPLCTHIVQRAISTATGLVLHTRDGCENVSCNPPPKKSVGWRLVILFSLFIFRCLGDGPRRRRRSTVAAILCVRLCWAASSHNQTSLSTNGWVATEREKLDAP